MGNHTVAIKKLLNRVEATINPLNMPVIPQQRDDAKEIFQLRAKRNENEPRIK
jgi:hypothetical protein